MKCTYPIVVQKTKKRQYTKPCVNKVKYKYKWSSGKVDYFCEIHARLVSGNLFNELLENNILIPIEGEE